MSLQRIIDRAQIISFDRRRIVGQTISRSQRIKVAERASAQPFVITITPPGSMNYTQNRDLIETISQKDRFQEIEIKLGANKNMAYVNAYRGGLTTATLAALTVTNFTNVSMTIGNLPDVSTSTLVFAAGDFIQPVNSRYPYIVTENVARGTGTSVTVTTNRPLITSENTTVTGALYVGTATSMRVVVSQLPTFDIIARDRIQWSGDFEVIEKII